MKNIVDKRRPTHDLKQMKILLDEENYRFTFTARKSYTSMELTEGEAVDIIKSLQQSDFEKSKSGRTHGALLIRSDLSGVCLAELSAGPAALPAPFGSGFE